MSSTQHLRPDTWKRVRSAVGEALDLPASAQADFLRKSLGDAPALLEEAMDLLRAHAIAAPLLEPAMSLSASALPMPRSGLDAGPSALGSMIGQQIGGCVLTRLIGVGGMGAVFEARQQNPDRRVAVKVLYPGPRAGGSSLSLRRRFEHEAQVLARLRHPGIAQIFETGLFTDPSTPDSVIPYFVMEFIPDALPLTQCAIEASLSLHDRLRLMIAVCEAAHHGHQRGVIHRDLKPANILVEKHAGRMLTPRIIDFGVARVTNADIAGGTMNTGIGQLVGTLQYMSPEQCAGDAGAIDIRSDVYSLGLILYELLTGVPATDLTGLDFVASIARIREGQPLPLAAHRPELAGDLETIVRKALRKDPAERYQSATDLAADLSRFLGHQPIAARPPSAIYQFRLFTRRNRPLVWGAVCTLICLVAGTIGTTMGLLRARQAQASAEAQAARARRVSSFLFSTIRSADPNQASLMGDPSVSPETVAWGFAGQSGGKASVREVLNAAAARIATEFSDDPLAQADLSYLMGVTLLSLDEVQTGSTLVRTAADLRQKHLPTGNPATLIAMLRQADVERVANDNDRVHWLLARAWLDGAQALGPAHDLTLRAGHELIENIANESCMQQMHLSREELIAAARAQFAAAEQSHGTGSPAAAREQLLLAELHSRFGDTQNAISMVREVFTRLGPLTATSCPEAFEAAGTLATLLIRQDGERWTRRDPRQSPQLLEAITIQRTIHEVVSKRDAANSPGLLNSRAALMGLYLRAGLHDLALDVATDALNSAEQFFDPGRDRVMKAKAYVARCLLAAGKDPARAMQLAHEATLIEEASELEAGHWIDPAGWKMWYRVLEASAVRASGQAAIAASMFESQLAVVEPRSPVGAAWCWCTLYTQYAACLVDLGRLDEAAKILDRAREFGTQIEDARHQLLWDIEDVANRLATSAHR